MSDMATVLKIKLFSDSNNLFNCSLELNDAAKLCRENGGVSPTLPKNTKSLYVH